MCRRELNFRPVLPEGQKFGLGDVVELQSDGRVRLIGPCQDVLGVAIGAVIRGGVRGSKTVLTGKDVNYSIVPKGTASTLFPEIGNADVRLEVKLSRRDSVFALIDRPTVRSIKNPSALFGPILTASSVGTWNNSYSLITDVASPVSYKVVRAKSVNTNVLFKASVDVGSILPDDPIALATKLNFAASSKSVDQYQTSREVVLFNSIAVRKPPIWSFDDPPIIGDSPQFLVSDALNGMQLAD